MSAIRPEDFLRYFEDAHSIRFMDAATGRPALDILMKEKRSMPTQPSDYDLWLEQQDETTRLEQKTGEF